MENAEKKEAPKKAAPAKTAAPKASAKSEVKKAAPKAEIKTAVKAAAPKAEVKTTAKAVKTEVKPAAVKTAAPKVEVKAEAKKPAVKKPVKAAKLERNLRKTKIGIVSSDKMEKTIVVAVVSNKKHPLYKKVVKTTKKFFAHDEKNEAQLGDTVEIVETRPISKNCHFRLLRVIERAK